MGDIVGRLFREFAVTLAVTILVSAVVSLTLTPMMAAKLLKHKPKSEHGCAFYKKSEEFFEYVIAKYGKSASKWVLAHQTLHAAGDVGHLRPHAGALRCCAQRLLPGAGHGRSSGDYRGRPVRQRSPAMSKRQQTLAKTILRRPGCRFRSAAFIGIDAQQLRRSTFGPAFKSTLKDKDKRHFDAPSR